MSPTHPDSEKCIAEQEGCPSWGEIGIIPEELLSEKESECFPVDGAVEGVTRYVKSKYIDLAPDGTIVSYGKRRR